MTLSHAGSSQKKRRTRRRKVTGMPCQGRSAMVLVYRECVRAEPLPHRGQTEVASAEAALSVIRPALAERQMRSRFCESGRMVWFGIGDLGEWRNVGCPKQHARRFHRKPGRTDSMDVKREEGEIEGWEIFDPEVLNLEDVAFKSIRKALEQYLEFIQQRRNRQTKDWSN